MTAFALYFHTAGIFFVAMQRNVVQVFYAQRDTKTPTLIAAVVMVLHIALCYSLAIPLRHGGIAAAGSVAAAFNVALLYVVLRRRIGRLGSMALARSLCRTAIATLVMSALVAVPRLLGAFDGVSRAELAWRLALTILAAMVCFALVARLLGSEELGEFAALVRRKFSRHSR